MTDVKKGDRVRVTHTTESTVKSVVAGAVWLDNGAVVVPRDEQSRNWTTDIEVLKHPKGDPGDVIDGRRLKDTWWKRGTTVYSVEDDCALMLHANARWYDGRETLSGHKDSFSFDAIEDDEEFVLLAVPE